LNRSDKVALVTGANRGIGLEISRQLSKKGVFVLMGTRSFEKGRQAAKKLDDVESRMISPIKLDVTNRLQIQDAIKKIQRDYAKLDILVNNAGILIDKSDFPSKTEMEIVRKTFETNLIRAWQLTNAVIPLMRKNHYGRIVNVSSGAGSLSSIAGSLYSPAYSISKAALNALTMMIARELEGTNILVNCMSPGWVRTDMGGKSAPRSVEEGADTAVWLATLPDDGPSGGFFEDRKRIAW
jgi:NAD(P)-dependent dehydrogenase (short-subunit alcohol dehydrogenase family)